MLFNDLIFFSNDQNQNVYFDVGYIALYEKEVLKKVGNLNCGNRLRGRFAID